MGDKLGIDRLIEALSAAASERQKAERELDRMQNDQASQQASLDKLKDIQTMIKGILLTSENFDYTKKRAVLYLLNVKVTVYPRGYDNDVKLATYTVTTGRNNDVKLPLYCDPNVLTFEALAVQLH